MSGVRRAALASLAGTLVLLAAPGPGGAAGAQIEPEPGTTVLPGVTAGAVAVDTDAGSVLVRLVETAGGGLSAEAWVERADGWARHGEGAALVGPLDEVRLVVARLRGVATAVAVSSARSAFVCCTRVVALRVDAGGVVPELVGEFDRSIDAAIAADLDGDGSDELVMRSIAVAASDVTRTPPTLHVARMDGQLDVVGRFRLLRERWETPFLLGDTDGVPGEEVGLLDHSGPGYLARFTWRPETGIRLEETSLYASRLPRQDLTGVRTLPDGSILAVNTGSSNLARWPAGADAELLASGSYGGIGLGGLTDGAAVRVVTVDLLDGTVRILDERLRRLESFDAPGSIFGSAWLPQYTGPMPLADGASAVAAYGTLYRLAGGDLDARPIAALGATQPIAVLGSDGAWLALVRTLDGRPLHAVGGELRSREEWAGDAVSIAPAELVFTEQPALAPTEWLELERAVAGEPAARDPGSLPLTVADDGYRVTPQVPAETHVHVRGAPDVPDVVRVGLDPVRLDLDSGATSSDPILVAVVTPSGRSYTARLTVERILGGDPPLEVAAATQLFEPSVRVTGRTTPGAQLTVDGQTATVDDVGRFVVEAPAGVVPRSLRIEVIDPIGQRTGAELTVVGFADYLGVPWAAVMAIGGLAIVAFIVWRRPPAAGETGGEALQDLGAEIPDELAAILRPAVATPHQDLPMPDPRDEPPADDAPDPDVLPTDAPRGAQTIPSASQTGTTTPPITGFGETLTGQERTEEPPENDEPER